MKKIDQNYRLYAFSHSWLSGVQKGIQAQHAGNELVHYAQKSNSPSSVKKWVEKDKTIILLEGGNSASLKKLYSLLKKQRNLSYMDFREDEDSLEGARTSVVVIIPESMYGFDFKLFNDEKEQLNAFHEANPNVSRKTVNTVFDIVKIAKSSRLAV